MKCLIALLLFFCIITLTSFAQTNPNNIPKPPTDKLNIYEPFFGKYTMVSDYAGLKFNGTIEIKPVIKGWYVEQIILLRSQDNKIDREFHMMVTYDKKQNKYRVWRFETLPPVPENIEITLRTEGTDIILESKGPTLQLDGKPIIVYNRYSKPSEDQLKIVSETHSLDGQVLKHVGISNATRIK